MKKAVMHCSIWQTLKAQEQCIMQTKFLFRHVRTQQWKKEPGLAEQCFAAPNISVLIETGCHWLQQLALEARLLHLMKACQMTVWMMLGNYLSDHSSHRHAAYC
ncbi:hypothetical protein ABBQ38_002631 [Trebouxia sp. C0009 RCD-2024]